MRFLNISNHPSARWDEKQKQAALSFGAGEIVDIQFPNVPPTSTERELEELCRLITGTISQQDIVHVMGEMGLTYKIVSVLRAKQVETFHSTTERIVEEVDGKKVVRFEFVQFRPYFWLANLSY